MDEKLPNRQSIRMKGFEEINETVKAPPVYQR